jgi:hypothetical protein
MLGVALAFIMTAGLYVSVPNGLMPQAEANTAGPGGALRPFPQSGNDRYAVTRVLPSGRTQLQMDQDVADQFNRILSRYIVDPTHNNSASKDTFYMVLNHPAGTGNVGDDGVVVCEAMGFGMVILAYMAGAEEMMVPSSPTNLSSERVPLKQRLRDNLPAALRASFGNDEVTIKHYFDAMFRTMRAFPATNGPPNHGRFLMAWQIRGRAGPWTAQGISMSTATDGALDMTYALLAADRQWGGPAHGRTNAASGAVASDSHYMYWAKGAMHQLLMGSVNTGIPTAANPTYTMTIGNWVNNHNRRITRPSDFMITHWKSFAHFGSQTNWNRVINGTYHAVNQARHPATGLLPDFLWYGTNNQWRPLGVSPSDGLSHFNEIPGRDAIYSYNACRVPWRLGLDILHSGTASSIHSTVQTMNNSMRDRADGNWGSIRGGNLDGTLNTQGDWWSGTGSAYQAPYLVTAASFGPQAWMTDGWDWARARSNNPDTYGCYIQVLSMIAASGNWWNPVLGASTTPWVSVGAQDGELNAGTGGTVTFPITAINIPAGNYDATVNNLPDGVTRSAAPTQINIAANGTGTLSLTAGTAARVGHRTNLTLTLHVGGTIGDVTSVNQLALTIIGPMVTVTPNPAVFAGTSGNYNFRFTSSQIPNGNYSATLNNPPAGVTLSLINPITNNNGGFQLQVTAAVPAGVYNLTLTLHAGGTVGDVTSEPFVLLVRNPNMAVGFLHMSTGTGDTAAGFNNAAPNNQIEFDITQHGDHTLTLDWPAGGTSDVLHDIHRDIYLLQPTAANNPRRLPVRLQSVSVNGSLVFGPMAAHAEAPARRLEISVLGTANPVTTSRNNANAQGTVFSDARLELRTFYPAQGAFAIPAGARVDITYRVGIGTPPAADREAAFRQGSAATFTVDGDPSMTFLWQELIGGTWTDIDGATGNTLKLTELEPGVYNYRVIVTGGGGTPAEFEMKLTVRKPDYGAVSGRVEVVGDERKIIAGSNDVTLLRRYIAAAAGGRSAQFRANNPEFNLLNANVNGDMDANGECIINADDVALLRLYVASGGCSSITLGPQ